MISLVSSAASRHPGADAFAQVNRVLVEDAAADTRRGDQITGICGAGEAATVLRASPKMREIGARPSLDK